MITHIGRLTDLDGQSHAINFNRSMEGCIYGMKLVFALTDKEQEILRNNKVVKRGNIVKIWIVNIND